MYKIFNKFLLVLLISLISIPITIKAETYDCIKVSSYLDDTYRLSLVTENSRDKHLNTAYVGQKLSDLTVQASFRKNVGNQIYSIIIGTWRWENPEYVLISGKQTVKLLYDTIDGEIISVDIDITPFDDGIKEKVVEKVDNIEDVFYEDNTDIPLLTATALILSPNTAYDINVENKLENSSFEWTSNNPSIATINPKSGYVKAVKIGNAKITCKITNGNNTQILTTDVIVGTDENCPILSDTDLDLLIGDTYDLDIENKIAKSKYKFTTSDKSVVKVNSKSGFMRIVGEGKAIVQCTITTPSKKVIILQCEINATK